MIEDWFVVAFIVEVFTSSQGLQRVFLSKFMTPR
jgi:hypothetical protein